MARAFFERMAPSHTSESVGLHPGAQIDPLVIRVMGDVGIDISEHKPRAITADAVARADVIVRSLAPDPDDYAWPNGPRYIDWRLPMPADENAPTLAEIRRLRDAVELHAAMLVREIANATTDGS